MVGTTQETAFRAGLAYGQGVFASGIGAPELAEP